MRIAISSEPRLLHILRAIVKFRAQEAGFPEAQADGLAVAIDEAASNVIRHTYANRLDAQLTLEITAFEDRIEFALEDSGPKVREENLQPRALEAVRPGGLGTHFIREIMDESSYDGSVPSGNRLRMVKYLPGRFPK